MNRGIIALESPDTRPDSNYDAQQLVAGTKVELEHGHDKEIAKKICKDHLDESPDYYIALDKMEKELKSESIIFTPAFSQTIIRRSD